MQTHWSEPARRKRKHDHNKRGGISQGMAPRSASDVATWAAPTPLASIGIIRKLQSHGAGIGWAHRSHTVLFANCTGT